MRPQPRLVRLAFLAAFGAALVFADASLPPGAAAPASTCQIVGGQDTTIRLIAIAAPETHLNRRATTQSKHLQRTRAAILALGRRAKDDAEHLAHPGTMLRVDTDVTLYDRYNRLLAYPWLKEMLLNEELLRQDYAMILTIPPNVRYAERFLRAQREARAACRDLWAL
jgi:micrococcal nuclease